jgi:GntR family carbon starvation induced transcriptional regulator
MASQGEGAGSVQLSSQNLAGDPWSSSQSEPPTRAQWVDQRLRQAILSGELAPDERLITATLSERFSVSPTPLREALQRLAAEGLVEITPQRGARVAALSATDWLEVIELRTILEPIALRDSFAHASDADFAGMERAGQVLAATVMPGRATPLEIAAANRSLHDALLSRATSRQLIRMIAVLSAQSMRYHVLALATAGADGLVLAHGEQLHKALRARDARQAELILTAHLDALREAAPGVSSRTSGATPAAPGRGEAMADV